MYAYGHIWHDAWVLFMLSCSCELYGFVGVKKKLKKKHWVIFCVCRNFRGSLRNEMDYLEHFSGQLLTGSCKPPSSAWKWKCTFIATLIQNAQAFLWACHWRDSLLLEQTWPLQQQHHTTLCRSACLIAWTKLDALYCVVYLYYSHAIYEFQDMLWTTKPTCNPVPVMQVPSHAISSTWF